MASRSGDPGSHAEAIKAVRRAAKPFGVRDPHGLDSLVETAGHCRIVLIGECSHGTSEFYRLRQRLTRRLIQDHGFTIVAAEADWPDAAAVDTYTCGRSNRALAETPVFERFPRWMWRNAEFQEFTEWLRGHNARTQPDAQCSFHGLDLYSLNRSIHEVIRFLDGRDPALGQLARERYACILPFAEDPRDYGHALLMRQHRDCEGEVAAMLADLLRGRIDGAIQERRGFFDAEQNARIIRNAERYYRAVYRGGAEAWNVRDRHMFETLLEILSAADPQAKAVVWAHNTHVGDASATQMSARHELNLGQLTREHFGADACLIGFGTHTGTVAAAHDWGNPVRIMGVRPSLEESHERLMHEVGIPSFALDIRNADDSLHDALAADRLERAIGVIYRPDTERISHYFTSSLADQFDQYLWVDETSAIHPLDTEAAPRRAKQLHPYSREDR